MSKAAARHATMQIADQSAEISINTAYEAAERFVLDMEEEDGATVLRYLSDVIPGPIGEALAVMAMNIGAGIDHEAATAKMTDNEDTMPA